MESLEVQITQLIVKKVADYTQNNLFRPPLVAFSAACDARYDQLKIQIGPWHNSPRELLPGVQSVISYFVPFTRQVVAAPKGQKDGSLLWGEAYQETNRYFEEINRAICDFLAGQGHSAMPIPSTHTYDPQELKSMWSHRSAAAIAGLGFFGVNRMLITEKGSGGRFCSVLTSAPLQPNTQPVPNRCLYHKDGSCGLCLKACPVGALRPDGFEKFVCSEELTKNETLLKAQYPHLYSVDVCGKCISACPFAYLD